MTPADAEVHGAKSTAAAGLAPGRPLLMLLRSPGWRPICSVQMSKNRAATLGLKALRPPARRVIHASWVVAGGFLLAKAARYTERILISGGRRRHVLRTIAHRSGARRDPGVWNPTVIWAQQTTATQDAEKAKKEAEKAAKEAGSATKDAAKATAKRHQARRVRSREEEGDPEHHQRDVQGRHDADGQDKDHRVPRPRRRARVEWCWSLVISRSRH